MKLTDKPTVPGWYWVKNLEDSSWLKIIYFCADEIEDMLDDWQSWSMSWNEGMMIHMGAQFFGPIPTPDKVVEAWAVFNGDRFFNAAPSEKLAQQEASMAMFGTKLQWADLERQGGTCRRVLVVEGGGE